MASRTLLLPCAGKSSRYPGTRPKWMLTLPEGGLALKRAADSVPAGAYDRVVIAVRADHEEKFGCRKLLRRAFGDGPEVLVLEEDTRGPADTVFQMVQRAGITGPIAVKDADSFFQPAPLPEGSFVTVCDVRLNPRMANVGAKSFAEVDHQGRVSRIAEKNLVSNFASIGLYGFSDAALFAEHFEAMLRGSQNGEIFLSHVLTHLAGVGETVRALVVKDFIDVGTIEDWRRHVRAHGTLICDIDGVVFENHSQFFPPYWEDEDTPIAGNVAVLKAWQAKGAKLIFMTARPEAYRAKTDAALKAAGLEVFALIMGCPHGRRFLINDHAPSNPYPAAVAVNLKRNTPSLGDYLEDWL